MPSTRSATRPRIPRSSRRVAAAGIDHGKTVVAPIAVRTDKITVLGSGKLDLGTEAIDLVWTIKPRSGAGISAGSIANPYIRLGGTLASPRLEVKQLQAAASTGAAVATLGVTILSRGIYNRITAEKQALHRRARQDPEARGPARHTKERGIPPVARIRARSGLSRPSLTGSSFRAQSRSSVSLSHEEGMGS